jgi:hypothetical protein
MDSIKSSRRLPDSPMRGVVFAEIIFGANQIVCLGGVTVVACFTVVAGILLLLALLAFLLFLSNIALHIGL